MEQRDKLTVEQCRELLGPDGEDWPDDKIERLRDRLEALAEELYPVIGQRAAEDLEGLRWASYLHRNGLDHTDITQDPDFESEISDGTAEDDSCPVQ